MYFNSQQQQGKTTTKKTSNNTESLILQVHGPLTGNAIIRGWGGGGGGLLTGIFFFCLQVVGPITGLLITGILLY